MTGRISVRGHKIEKTGALCVSILKKIWSKVITGNYYSFKATSHWSIESNQKVTINRYSSLESESVPIPNF